MFRRSNSVAHSCTSGAISLMLYKCSFVKLPFYIVILIALSSYRWLLYSSNSDESFEIGKINSTLLCIRYNLICRFHFENIYMQFSCWNLCLVFISYLFLIFVLYINKALFLSSKLIYIISRLFIAGHAVWVRWPI